MWVVFFGLWVALDSILGGLGQVVEPSKPYLSMIFGISKHASQKCSSCNKTTVFAMFHRLRNMPHTATEHVFCIAFKAFLNMVQGLLQEIPAGIHFLLFITTLQRGGTCAAHPPPPEGMPCVSDSNHFIFLIRLPLKPASKQSLKCLLQMPSPILLFLPPDPHVPPHFARNLLLRPQNAIF